MSRQHPTTERPHEPNPIKDSGTETHQIKQFGRSAMSELQGMPTKDFQQAVKNMQPGSFGKSTTDFLPKDPIDY